MFDRRSRARRFGQPPPPPPKAKAPPPKGERTVEFHVSLQGGYGDVGLLDFVSESSESAKIDFQCRVHGWLRILINREQVLYAKTMPGRAMVTGLFFPSGAHIVVIFTNEVAGGSVSGRLHISPLPMVDTLISARAAFGLNQNYTAEELRRAHQRLMLRWHPDRPGGDTAKTAELNHYRDLLKAALEASHGTDG